MYSCPKSRPLKVPLGFSCSYIVYVLSELALTRRGLTSKFDRDKWQFGFYKVKNNVTAIGDTRRGVSYTSTGQEQTIRIREYRALWDCSWLSWIMSNKSPCDTVSNKLIDEDTKLWGIISIKVLEYVSAAVYGSLLLTPIISNKVRSQILSRARSRFVELLLLTAIISNKAYGRDCTLLTGIISNKLFNHVSAAVHGIALFSL
ncbi:hypothetical protein WOLCODRAFT_18290 [Wolfiporia cocos MD-104 SS10]|uniref:Uncharacterized protein n=1 Tax=Wolfiporia cocos (strain MD-104) TaxID=742152 RepID=A0A2H3JP94_WOLCO|nr:hypothetical protein WOLCODRAFT_18290 [Wolfiporia cocos MD-104 SS10]